MPDDMLENAISVSKAALDENEFESNGVEVSFIFINKNFKFLIKKRQEINNLTYQIFNFLYR